MLWTSTREVLRKAFLLSAMTAASAVLSNPAIPAAPAAAPESASSALDPEVAALLRTLEQETEKNSKSATAWGQLGLAHDANLMPKSAAPAYQRAAELAPSEPRWLYHLARMKADVGDVDGALQSMSQVLALERNYAPAYGLHGQWLLDVGRVDEAEVAFLEMLRLEPKSVQGRIGLARVLSARRQEEETVALLEGILEEDPSNAYVFQLLGNSLRRTGNTELAREAFALCANPRPPSWPDPWKDARTQYQVGFAARLESALGRLSGPESAAAVTELEELNKKQPGNVALLSNLGAAYCRTGRLPEGIATLQAALQERPEHFASLANLSLAYEASGDMGQALAVAERAVRAHTELVQAHMRLGSVLAKLSRHEDALTSFQNARRLDQRSVVSVFRCGSMNGELGRWNEAALDFEAVLAAEPRMVGTWAWLALARAEAGDLVSARAALAEAEKRAPNDPKLPEVRRRIDELERTASAR